MDWLPILPEFHEIGFKNIQLVEVYELEPEEVEKEFKINTDAEYLGDALLEEKIVTKDEYKNGGGMYTYIADERADYTLDKSWWCLTVGGEMKFACVDGPEFDGHLVDFDEAMERASMYREFERHAYDDACNLLNKGAK